MELGFPLLTLWGEKVDGCPSFCRDRYGSEPDPLPPSQAPEGEAVVSVENLPLESKQQLMMEQKLRMKLAKKIRLRRKRLVRKRRMRKKGRWPPSKMKKNKNV
ncbi:50S ribosomal protein 5 alpha, chloroplastic [Iris pallida]|uniref:50S ribosomal protein 5 alpha, chloroplastic n=1 Tax=Iris pallida TaxID=29817 RepID=A0AAX6EP14_IRIPA|nr:50S ribosomal protein 5 alpha, chloroplastic [Iris pallida]